MGTTRAVGASLGGINPKLAAEWHPTKNGDLTPFDVAPRGNQKVWWLCPRCRYEWAAIISNRGRGVGCPACTGRVATAQTSLAALRPDLAAEWHASKNAPLTPDDVRPGSFKVVWWQCAHQHEWQRRIGERVQGGGCPICAGRLVTPENCLAAANPDLAAEWHPTKNKPMTPNDVHPRSSRKVWWRCSRCQYEWRAEISGRGKGRGCRACAGQIVTDETCLANAHPDLVAEWHPIHNAPLVPHEVHYGSSQKVWWRCGDCAYEWQASPRARSRGAGCPLCKGRAVTADTCLAAVNPELAREWNEAKNGTLTPRHVHTRSARKVWWRCPACGHEWDVTVGDRSRGGRRCPACSGRVLTAANSLAAKNPTLAAEWHPTRNRTLTPADVRPLKNRKAWWQCSTCGYEWEARIDHRHNGSGCPACRGSVATAETSLAALHPRLLEEWDYEANQRVGLDPASVRPGSSKVAHWRCREGHRWAVAISDRAGKRGHGCPYCSGHRVTDETSLAALHPRLLEEWDYEANQRVGLDPASVRPGSSKVAQWRCQQGHRWEAAIAARAGKRAHGCPYCAGKRAGPDNSLAALRPEMLAEWDYDANQAAGLDPALVRPRSNKKAHWVCVRGHRWEASISNRVGHGRGCPYCANQRVMPENSLADSTRST